jgi:hypothetical protein
VTPAALTAGVTGGQWLLFAGFGTSRGGTRQAVGARCEFLVRAPYSVAVEACRHVVWNIVSKEPPEELPPVLVEHRAAFPQRFGNDRNSFALRRN